MARLMIDLSLDVFEDRLREAIERQNFTYLRDQAVKAAQWLEEHEGNPVQEWTKLNNATSLFCTLARQAVMLSEENTRLTSAH